MSFGAAIGGGLAIGRTFGVNDPATASWVVASGTYVTFLFHSPELRSPILASLKVHLFLLPVESVRFTDTNSYFYSEQHGGFSGV
jgi:hypothetical protein